MTLTILLKEIEIRRATPAGPHAQDYALARVLIAHELQRIPITILVDPFTTYADAHNAVLDHLRTFALELSKAAECGAIGLPAPPAPVPGC
jgi:hypothetical protein